MKWIVLAIMLGAIPVLSSWLRGNPRRAPLLSGMLGLLLFVYAPYNLSVAPYPWPMWPGYVKGILITVPDVIALAIVIANRHRTFKMPFRWQMIFYLAAVVLAIPQSAVPIASTFYVWQLFRVYIMFRAVALVAQDDRHRNAIIAGMILGVAFQTLEAGWARTHGAAQSGGTLGHQNLLGMLTNMVLMPAIAMALAGIRVRWAMFGIAFAAAALVFTASRAAIGIAALGVVLVVLISLSRSPSSRKSGMAFFAVLALGLTAPFAISSLSNRFQGGNINFSFDSDEVRNRMVVAAEMMISDHPFGVGSNYFVVEANKGGYWNKARVPYSQGNMGANVHNSYLLVQAETGFIGLLAILALLFSGIAIPLRIAFKDRLNVRGDVLIGFAVGLVTFAIQNRVEWGVVSENVQYMLAVNFGIIAGVARSLQVTKIRAAAARRRATSTTPDENSVGLDTSALPNT